MATLLEIRNRLLEKTGKDMFEPHPLYEGITDKILEGSDIGDGHIDYANLLESIIIFCEHRLRDLGFRDVEFEDE
jgi:hypothetical protein